MEDRHNQLEFTLTTDGSADDRLREEKIYLQTTPEFLALIDNYQKYLTDPGRPFSDLQFEGEMILRKEELRALYDEYYAYLPLKKRLVQLQQRAFYLLRPVTARKIKEYAQKPRRRKPAVNQRPKLKPAAAWPCVKSYSRSMRPFAPGPTWILSSSTGNSFSTKNCLPKWRPGGFPRQPSTVSARPS